MAIDPSSVRDRVQAVRIAADASSFMNVSALWTDCVNRELVADEADLSGLIDQMDTLLGRLVDERDFIKRMARGLGESKLEAAILREDILHRFSPEEVDSIRDFLTRDGNILTTLENIVGLLPATLHELRTQLRDQRNALLAGDVVAAGTIDSRTGCIIAATHLMMAPWLIAVGVVGAYEAILAC